MKIKQKKLFVSKELVLNDSKLLISQKTFENHEKFHVDYEAI